MHPKIENWKKVLESVLLDLGILDDFTEKIEININRKAISDLKKIERYK